ncbi:Uncharacterized protein Rs2_34946 [Raphanus sativus]|nr:Uncharacterized protein Rs2_34946 [Raphanus sativus]
MPVPPMLNRRNIPRENQQQRRQRPQLVYPLPLLNLHPLLYRLSVPHASSSLKIHHHHSRVEVAWPSPSERRKLLGRPQRRGEVLGEVRVAVLGSSDRSRSQPRPPQLGDVVDDDQIGIEVDHAPHARLQQIAR